MSRRSVHEAPVAPSLFSLGWLAGLMLGVAVGIVLVYHFLLASHAGGYVAAAKAAPVKVMSQRSGQADIGDAHARALREAMAASAKQH